MPSVKQLDKLKSLDQLKQRILNSGTGFDSKFVLDKAETELSNLKGESKRFEPNSYLYKSLTLFEFEKGVLLLNSLSDYYRIFALQFSKDLQSEYRCNTPSEKSLAEIVTLNFVRNLEIQTRIRYALESMKTRYDIQYLAVLSKELDKAQNHYLNALQSLRTLNSHPLKVNIKTNTAIVGQNQAVQVKKV